MAKVTLPGKGKANNEAEVQTAPAATEQAPATGPKKRPKKNAPAIDNSTESTAPVEQAPAATEQAPVTEPKKRPKKNADAAAEPAQDTKEVPETKPAVKVTTEQEEAASELLSACISAEQARLSVWQATGQFILADKLISIQTEKDAMAELFFAALNAAHDPAAIPEKGEDTKGNEIDLRHEDGSVKWRSWCVTARMVQNISDIFKGILLLGEAEVFPKGELISRRKLLAAIEAAQPPAEEPPEPGEGAGEDDKEKELPIETVKRCLLMVDQMIGKLDIVELKQAYELLDSVIAGVEQAIEAIEPETAEATA